MTWQQARWVIGAAVGIFLVLLVTTNKSTSSADRALGAPLKSSSGTKSYGSSANSDTPSADAFTSSSGAYMDDREKALYEKDPSSMGYTDEDRDFLKEHGLSEDEARAAETILHREGVE